MKQNQQYQSPCRRSGIHYNNYNSNTKINNNNINGNSNDKKGFNLEQYRYELFQNKNNKDGTNTIDNDNDNDDDTDDNSGFCNRNLRLSYPYPYSYSYSSSKWSIVATTAFVFIFAFTYHHHHQSYNNDNSSSLSSSSLLLRKSLISNARSLTNTNTNTIDPTNNHHNNNHHNSNNNIHERIRTSRDESTVFDDMEMEFPTKNQNQNQLYKKNKHTKRQPQSINCEEEQNDKDSTTSSESSESSGWVTSIPPGLQYTLISVLILFSAFFSGLTLSMMGLDTTGLEIVMSGDDAQLSRAASKIYPVRKNGNLLLCTLLLGNVAVNTLLGILMAEITGGTVGFLTSTGLIVIFGEILPQALFSRYALQVGEKAVPLVKTIMILLYIIAKPLAFCLDKLLGHELGTTYSKSEMSKLLEIHVKEGRFNQEVGTAMKGALQYQDMIVKEVMTPLEHTFMISVDDRLNFEMMATIFKTGYSRIPVYESTVGNVIGLLFVKDLIFIDPEDATPVRELMQIFGRSTHDVWPDDKLGDVLRHLKSGHTHMALVRGVCNEEKVDPYYTLEGIITLEDIIEVILGEEIVDETDAWVDVDHTKKVSREKAFDWSRLRLLDAKIVDETLSDDEVRAVAAHLRQNYSCTVNNISDKQLMRMIAATAVTELEEVHKEAGEDLPSSSKLLYEKNKESSICTLILQGKVTVLAGNDNFRSDSSSWSVIATGALTDETYTPDFSAYVSSGPCRCLQFKREIFTAACDASILENIPLKKGLDNGTGMTRKETPLEIDNKTCTIDESGRNLELQTKSTESDRITASSNHSKADDIVERSEQRGRLLATLFCDFKKESKDSITEEG